MSVYQGSEIVLFTEPKVWGMLPDDYKDLDNWNIFKNKA